MFSETEQRHYMVSRMRIHPLPTLMPPTDLVERNRAFQRELADHLSHFKHEREREDQPHVK